jgi:hypothetical protein
VKILATFAHYYDAAGDAYYGSTGPIAAPRRDALRRAIAAFHQLFGPTQAKLLNRIRRIMTPANLDHRHEIDVVVCTTGGKHLLAELGVPASMYRHEETAAEPLMLGFECHRVLGENVGRYDYYCYLEDDIVLQDPWFFAKLKWFTENVGSDALLQPNRFELSVTEPIKKLYIDGHVSPEFASSWQDIADRPTVAGQVLGSKVVFERTTNPHSGCFFLNAAQMAAWKGKPYFLDRDVSFAGKLESAATLGIMKSFRVYKPAAANAGFLELLHADNRYLGNWLTLAGPPDRPQ